MKITNDYTVKADRAPRHEETLGAQSGAPKDVAEEYARTGRTPTSFVKQQLAAAAANEESAKLAGTTPEQAAENLDDMTAAELHQRAADADIEGRSQMNKDELIKAIKKSERTK